VGEVRGAEALELLKAWNTGHEGGVTTVHANSAAMTLLRLEMLVAEAGVPPNPRLIASTIHLIVFMKQQGRLQTVKELVRVDGWDPRTLQYQLTLIQFS
jgi:type IV secretion system protein VirB11